MLLILYFHFYFLKNLSPQASVYSFQPERTSWEDQRRQIQANSISLLRWIKWPYYEDVKLKGKAIRWYSTCCHLSVKVCTTCSGGAVRLRKRYTRFSSVNTHENRNPWPVAGLPAVLSFCPLPRAATPADGGSKERFCIKDPDPQFPLSSPTSGWQVVQEGARKNKPLLLCLQLQWEIKD